MTTKLRTDTTIYQQLFTPQKTMNAVFVDKLLNDTCPVFLCGWQLDSCSFEDLRMGHTCNDFLNPPPTDPPPPTLQPCRGSLLFSRVPHVKDEF